MLNAAETRQSAALAGAAGSAKKTETDVTDLFARELSSRMSGAGDARAKIAAGLEKMAGAFPGASITTSLVAGLEESYSMKSGSNSSITISPETMAAIADDSAMFERMREMIEKLLQFGKEQSLLPGSAGSATQRNVTVQGGTARYVEVQRGANGTQLSVASLSLQTQEMLDQTLNGIFARRDGSGNASSGSTGFQSLVGSSSSWRLEGFVSSQSSGFAGLIGGSASSGFQLRQSLTARMTVAEAYVEWSTTIEGGQASGVDLFTYMQTMGLTDPLVLDLGDEGINLSSAEDGVYFDIKGDGSPARTAFIKGNNAFLYLDDNGNGVADDVSELFGDFGGFANGFENLARYDDNGDGVIDEDDAVYSSLRLWRDLNGDGINQAEESLTLAEAGVKSIDLRYDRRYEEDGKGNVIGERSTFTRADGSQGTVADVWLRSV